MEQVNDDAFVVDNDQKAEWALRKIREIRDEHERLVRVCRDMIAHYENKVREYEEKRENDEEYLKGQLLNYFFQVPHKETKTQEKYTLPSGDLVLKKPAIKLLRPDDEELLGWVPESYVEIKKCVKWGELKKRLIVDEEEQKVIDGETGEAVPVKVEKSPESFDVKLKGV